MRLILDMLPMDATGNPNMSECAKMTRKAHILIGKKANLGTGEEDFNMKKGFIKSESVEGLEPPALSSGATAAATAGALTSGGADATRALASIILAGDTFTVDGGEQQQEQEEFTAVVSSSNLTPSLVQSIPKKTSYQQQRKSSVPDTPAFNEYIKSQEKR